MADDTGGAGATPAAAGGNGGNGLGDSGGDLAGVGQGPIGSGQGAEAPVTGKESSPVQPRPTAEAEGKERKIAPIPPPKRSRLPGVITGDDFPELQVPAKARMEAQARAEAQEGRERGADGRFLPKAPEGGVGAAPATKPALPGGETPAAPEPAPAPFKFAGREYKGGQAEAEQRHRSLEGMFQPMQARIKELTEDKDYGNRAANAWMAEANRYKAELERLSGGKPAEGNGKGQPAVASGEGEALSVEKLLEGIDTDAYEAVARAGGLSHSAKYLAGEMLKVVAEKMVPQIEARIQAKYEPLMASHENSSRVQQADQAIAQLASQRTPDQSRALFPELMDSRALGEMGNIWRQMGGSDEDLVTTKGLLSAIGLYRSTRDWLSTPESIAPTTPAVAPAPPAPAPGPAAMPSAEAGGNLPPNRGRSNLSPEAARLKYAMENVALQDKKLGFAKNPRSSAA